MTSLHYFQLTEQSSLPDIGRFAPFKVVLAIEDDISPARQVDVANWLVKNGGRYVMICGENIPTWKEAIRQANLALFDIENMTPEEFVMITTHERQGLKNVLWHAKNHARHTHVEFDQVIAIHLGNQNRSIGYLSMFNDL